MTELHSEPGSFRDPATRVFYADDRVFRGLDSVAAKDWAQLSGTNFFPELVAQGKAVKTEVVDASSIPGVGGDYAAILEHEKIPYISYPYEWTFEMLRDAAVLHLEILLAALEEDVSMKDGYAFNMQWPAPRPSSSTSVRSKVRAVGLGSGTASSARRSCTRCCSRRTSGSRSSGSCSVISTASTRPRCGASSPAGSASRKACSVTCTCTASRRARVTQGGQKINDEMKQSGFGKELTKATVTKLLKLVRKLRSKRADSGWKAYRETCSYSDEDRVAKERFLRAALDGLDIKLAWDLGCNDGVYSRIVAEQGAYVVAVDSDDVTVDVLYRALHEEGSSRSCPWS